MSLAPPLKDGTIIHRFTFGERTPEADYESKFTFQIAFEQEGPGQRDPLVPLLNHFLRQTEYIVSVFDQFF